MDNSKTVHDHGLLWLLDESLSQSDFTSAADYWEEIEDKETYLAAHFHGKLLYRSGDLNGALEIWKDIKDISALLIAAEDAERSLDKSSRIMAYQALYRLQPESFGLNYARVLVKNHVFTQAINVLENLLQLDPPTQMKSIVLRLLGDTYYKQGDWIHAGGYYTDALNIDPNNISALIGFAWSEYEIEGEVDKATAIFRDVEMLEPASGEGQYNQAQLFAREERFAEAIEKYTQALELETDNIWWYLRRARSADEGFDHQSAIEFFLEIIDKFPDDIRAYQEIASVYQKNGNITEALVMIEKAIDLMDIPDFSVFLQAGLIYEELGQIKNARSVYIKALEINPASDQVKNRLERIQEPDNQ